MADLQDPALPEQEETRLLTLEDEDGQECTFETLDSTEIAGTKYLAVVPYEEGQEPGDDEDLELIVMRVGEDEDGEYMDIVEDDDELSSVLRVFADRLRAIYSIDDSELQ